jgi:HK97 family phage major capsid protein
MGDNAADNTVDQVQKSLADIKNTVNGSIKAVEQKVVELGNKHNELSQKFENSFKENQRFGSAAEDEASQRMKKFGEFLRSRSGMKLQLVTREDPTPPVTGNIGTDAQGGYAVPFILDREILKKERDLNVMRQLCSNMSVSSPDTAWNIDLGGTTSGWVGETDTRSQTDAPQLGRATITWGEVFAMPQATQYLLDDAAFDVESWYTDSVAEEFADKEEEAFLIGNGTKKPKGILSYTFNTTADASRDVDKLQKVSGALTFDSILSLYYAVRQVYRRPGDCTWLMNGATIEALRKLKDEQNRYIWVDNLANGMAGTLLGCPVYESRYMPDASTNGNLAVLFGNFKKAYRIVDRLGLQVIRDPYSVKGQVAFYTAKRVGNVLTDNCAVKALAVSV